MANLWIIYGYGWWFQPTPLNNMKVTWDDDIPYGKIKKSSKAPTRTVCYVCCRTWPWKYMEIVSRPMKKDDFRELSM